jgi:uncharacterized protein (TIGR00290 family)
VKEKILFAWSSGKDSAMALYELKQIENIEITALLTTVTEGHDRISMHGVRRTLLAEQAKSLGYPLEEILIPQDCSNEIYEERMRQALEKHIQAGIHKVAFGDLFLPEVRSYREERLGQVGMQCLFPLWNKPTPELARRFIDLRFRAYISCVDTHQLSAEFAGREYDADFLRDLPPEVDPCGENGEFHSFACDGPIFSTPLNVKPGIKVLRNDRFYFCDLL